MLHRHYKALVTRKESLEALLKNDINERPMKTLYGLKTIQIKHVCRKLVEENEIEAYGIKAPYAFEFALSFWDDEDEEIMPEDVIESYKVLSEGCDELVVSKHGTTHGYPAPVVEYIVNDDVDPETLLSQVNESQVVIKTPFGIEYLFADMNDHTHLMGD